MRKLFGILAAAAVATASLPLSTAAAKEESLTSVISGNTYTYKINKDGTATLLTASIKKGSKKITIPDMIEEHPVSTIGAKAFMGCTVIEEITIPGFIEYIGEKAFMSCNNLRKVTIEEGVTAIPKDCFFSCPKLTTAALPDSLQVIGSEAFFSCTELDITLSPNVIKIGKDALGKESGYHQHGSIVTYGFLITGKRGSAAEKYAIENKVDFIDPEDFVLGDMDGDYKIDAADASLVLAEYSRVSTGAPSGLTKRQKIVGDINGDRRMDASDASLMLSIYSANSTGGSSPVTTKPIVTTTTTTTTTTTATTTTTTQAATTTRRTSRVIYTTPVYTTEVHEYPVYPAETTVPTTAVPIEEEPSQTVVTEEINMIDDE